MFFYNNLQHQDQTFIKINVASSSIESEKSSDFTFSMIDAASSSGGSSWYFVII